MEKEPKPVGYSVAFKQDLINVYLYGVETFGKLQAEYYQENIYRILEGLGHSYLMYAECKHLPTKSKMYRWIILSAHLIIYRITENEIQVLRMIHSRKSITKIRASRSIKF